MSEKIVVKVERVDGGFRATCREGREYRPVITERLLRKMQGLTTAYWYAPRHPDPSVQHVSLDRLAPFSAWAGETLTN